MRSQRQSRDYHGMTITLSSFCRCSAGVPPVFRRCSAGVLPICFHGNARGLFTPFDFITRSSSCPLSLARARAPPREGCRSPPTSTERRRLARRRPGAVPTKAPARFLIGMTATATAAPPVLCLPVAADDDSDALVVAVARARPGRHLTTPPPPPSTATRMPRPASTTEARRFLGVPLGSPPGLTLVATGGGRAGMPGAAPPMPLSPRQRRLLLHPAATGSSNSDAATSQGGGSGYGTAPGSPFHELVRLPLPVTDRHNMRIDTPLLTGGAYPGSPRAGRSAAGGAAPAALRRSVSCGALVGQPTTAAVAAA
jgi:hypothetical protein